MRIKSNMVGLVVLVVVIGGIAASAVFNLWNTTSDKEPARYQTGELKGEYDPSDIRGSYTLGDVSQHFPVSEEILAKAFGVSTEDGNYTSFQLKNLEGMYNDLIDQGQEIGTGSVRLFVGLYTGRPVPLDEEFFLPQTAVDILIEKGNLSAEQLAYIQGHTVEVSPEQQQNVTTVASEETTQSEDEQVVKGKTTFAELISWGVEEEKVEGIIGGKIPATGMTIRDYCNQKGISFSTVKDELNSLIESP